LNDLALTLAEKSAAFSASLPPAIAGSLEDAVRVANCHYSNLIEGRDIAPIDIERAMRGEYSDDAKTRDLQFEAQANINVEKWIDQDGTDATPYSTALIVEVHRRLYELCPGNLTGPVGLRTNDVRFSERLTISPGSVPRFLAHMDRAYKSASAIDRILSAACGHHRLLRVHPFLNHNEHVARLVSHAALRSAITMRGPWPLARGLAQRVDEYESHLRSCDKPRRGSHDGRGTLSEGALANFVEFFLKTCIDQVDFMSGLMQPHELQNRVLTWVHEEMRAGVLPPRSDAILTAILCLGELECGEIITWMGASERSARQLTEALVNSGVVQSETPRSTLRLAFPVELAMSFLPGLYPKDRDHP
jgi:Fic family protein